MILDVPYVKQREPCFCVPACGEMVARYHGYALPQEIIADEMGDPEDIAMEGSSLRTLANALKRWGFPTSLPWMSSYEELDAMLQQGYPCIATASMPHDIWSHVYVLKGVDQRVVYINDSWDARYRHFPKEHFWESWKMEDNNRALIVPPPLRSS
jgi:ABC-type bacteriocin/lantibiotic exporter with double-glycine peptidase domain